MNYTCTIVNSIYILCTSGPHVSTETLKRFGQFTVRINEPEIFRNELMEALKKEIVLERVLYNKDLVIEEKDRSDFKLTFSQKPEMFSQESEYRYVAIFPPSIPSETHMEVNIDRPMDYVEILS